MDFLSLAVGGIAIIPLVVGLVQVVKSLGVTGKSLIVWAVAFGAVFGALYKLGQMFPVMQPWVDFSIFVVGFALFGLAATGLVDLGKSWIGLLQKK